MSRNSVNIVGAGIAGLSTAFHLAERGAGSITLLDKDRVGTGSSIRSGAVNTMLMDNAAATMARGISFDIFERFDSLLPEYDFHQVGCLALYTPEQFAVAAKLHAMHVSAGAQFEILRRTEIEARFDDLRLRDEEIGVLDLRGGWSEPDRYIPALKQKVVELGVRIREACVVEDFLVESGEVRGVLLRGGEELRSDFTVCTVNSWANTLLSRVGQPLPIRNFVHERFVTRPFDEPPIVPATNDNSHGVYYRPTEDGRLLLGTGALEPEQVPLPGIDLLLEDLEPNAGSITFIADAVRERLPRLAAAPLVAHRVGLVSYPIDFVPNIGPVKALPGLQIATNFCSGGFGYHPVAGLLLAEYIVDGKTSIDAAIFSPDRFGDFDTKSYLAQEVTHARMVDELPAGRPEFVRKKH
ncbi:MAG: FAD-dependent oxidoreductase [Candidatus Latescibacterota bacterium]|nr:FAD-dependent oxidoreductase [Candidatus Latescibacterota bacterium]